MYFIRCSEHKLSFSFWYSSVISVPFSAPLALAYTYNTTKVYLSLSSNSVTICSILSARFSKATSTQRLYQDCQTTGD